MKYAAFDFSSLPVIEQAAIDMVIENSKDWVINTAKVVIQAEANSLNSLAESIGIAFASSISLLLKCKGNVITAGIGKSSHIARKVSSTFASTGTPSFFIHPSEASHGDLGMVKECDLLITFSKSGESCELYDLLGYCKLKAVPIIGITANGISMLASMSTQTILIPLLPEACSLGLAPSTSTAMMLALGDALAIVCADHRKLSKTEFKLYHPGGKLGQSLLKVSDLMHTGVAIPIADRNATVSDAILEMTRCRFGCVGIVDESRELTGIFTDGDLRRTLPRVDLNTKIVEVMTINPIRLNPSSYVTEVLDIFKLQRIPSAFVCEDNEVIGILHIHDLLQRGAL